MARWYYGGADNPTGPIDQTDLVRLAAEGAIKPTDLVWRDGSSKWVLAARVKGLQFGSPPPPPQPAKPVSLFAAEVSETAKALRWMAAGGIICAALGIPIIYHLQQPDIKAPSAVAPKPDIKAPLTERENVADLPGYAAKTEAKPKTQEEIREERIKKHFSWWDGSHRGLTKEIMNLMNDPRSYDHVETVYWDFGEYLIVRTTFRGKNAFGGVVKNWVKAKVDLDGNVLEIMELWR